MSIKWSESVMLKFLELYEKYDCLWNHRLEEYKNKNVRANALASFVGEMGIAGLTVADLKNKIKTVRTMYKKENSLIYKSKKSGASPEELYVPKLFWYKRADMFLNGVTTSKDTSSNLNVPLHNGAESKSTHNEEENSDEIEFTASTSSSLITKNGTQEKKRLAGNSETANPFTTKQLKRANVFRAPNIHKRKMINENISTISAAIEKLVQSSKSEADDEFEIFGKYVAVQIKQMPLYDAIICQEEVQTLIREKRLEILSRTQYVDPKTLSPAVGGQWSSSVSETSNQELLEEDSQETSDKYQKP
ncbi:uncharacterized protein LOC106662812 [Cimex lectularius]|uniref:MADF domain-containing protein n=1 Tax=Cimex lectularius TaxID=79782 RepID=A0A8I6RBF5_CIMLE|nr:uncharacterized protein LOC106662812 [Cimex lectularius]